MKVIITFIVLAGLAQGMEARLENNIERARLHNTLVLRGARCSTSTIRILWLTEVYDTLCGKEQIPCKRSRYVARKQPCCTGFTTLGNNCIPEKSSTASEGRGKRVKRHYCLKFIDGSSDPEHCTRPSSSDIPSRPGGSSNTGSGSSPSTQYYCWPGPEPSSFCKCPPGFSNATFEKSTNFKANCQLVKTPSITSCKLKGIGSTQVDTRSGTNSSCQEEEDVYINFVPSQVNVTLHVHFHLPVNSLPSLPSSFQNSSFGIESVRVGLVIKPPFGPEQTKEVLEPEVGACDESFDSDKLLNGLTECNVQLNTTSLELNSGDWLCVTLEANASGRLKSRQGADFIYPKTSTSKTLCLRYDNSPPEHCSVKENCSIPPIQVQSHVTKAQNITVSVSGWTDPQLDNSTRNTSSGIEKMTLTLHETRSFKQTLTVSHESKATFDVTNGSANVTLPREPALYALELEVKDRAHNTRRARTLVLFDNSSRLQLNDGRRINVTSAIPRDTVFWQTSASEFCLSWEDHFSNSFHGETNFLLPLQPVASGLVSGPYDYSTPRLPSNGTVNVHGVTSFAYSVEVNGVLVQNDTTLTDVRQQGTCFQQTTSDGDLLEVTISATDIMGDVISDNVSVFVDRSAPEVTMLSTVPGLDTWLYVHGSADLASLVVRLEAMDPHSGLVHLRWTLGYPESPGYIGNGTWPVQRFKEGDSCSSCYSPIVGAPENYSHSLSMEKLVAAADHNRDYVFTVTAENGAGLQTRASLNILVDTSPPERGVVWEGTEPDIEQDEDFTSANVIHLRWSGFLDHESGILKYRVALGRQCLTANEISSAELTSGEGSDFPLIQEVTGTNAKIFLNAEGKFKTTVIAYNKALLTSQPVCSDGIMRDVTPPVFHNVTLRGSGTREGLVCLSNRAHLLQRNVTLAQLNFSACAEECQRESGVSWLSVLPRSFLPRIDENETESSCEGLRDLSPGQPVIYVPNSNIFLDWSLEEDESQIQETLIGFGTSPSLPNLEDFRPTLSFRRHHHNHEGRPSATPLYVLLRATNKAGISADVTLGPLVVDETPPRVLRPPTVSTNSSTATLVMDSADFLEEDEDLDALEYTIHLGHAGASSSVPGDHLLLPDVCPSSAGPGSRCYSVSRGRLRQLAGEEARDFFFSVHIRDLAGHIVATQTAPFQVPSLLPPGQGRVFDLDPDDPTLDKDVDFQMTSSQVCMSWEGFRSHDDVIFYVGVGAAAGKDDVRNFSLADRNITWMCLTDLHLKPHVRYVSTVKAISPFGVTVVSSDGVTALEPSSFPSLLVWDGLGCRGKVAVPLEFLPLENTEVKATVNNLHPGMTYTLASPSGTEFSVTSSDVVWLPSSHISISETKSFLALWRSATFKSNTSSVSLGILDCIEDLKFSFESSLSAHWNYGSGKPAFPVRFSVSLLENKCLEGSPRMECLDSVVGFQDVGDATHHIFDEVNLALDATYHVAVRPCYGHLCGNASLSDGLVFQPHPALTSALTLSRETSNSSCLTFALRWDPFTCGATVATHYHVTLTEMDNWSGQQSAILSRGLTVGDEDGHSIQSECLQSQRGSPKIVRGCVTGVCLSGQEATTCHLLTPDLVPSPLRDLDVGQASLSSHGNEIDGTRGATMRKEDVDFVRAKVTLAASLDLQWEGQLEWFLLRGREHHTGPCSDNPNCLHWTRTSRSLATFPELVLEDGQRYQICVKSSAAAGSHGNETSSLVCSDGFLVDDAPPSAPELRIANAIGGFVRSLSTVHIRWSDVIDLDLKGREEGASGIASVAFSIGTREGNADLHPWTTTLASSALLQNLNLTNGLTCYANLQVTDRVGLTRLASRKFVVDTTPPALGHVTVGAHEGYVTGHVTEVRWGGFRDPESGLRHFLVRVSSVEGQGDVFATRRLQGSAASVELDRVVDGHTYRVEVSAVNGVGLKSTLNYDVIADTSPPTHGFVKTQVTTKGGRSRIGASWDKFQDVHSGLSFYRVGIGTKPSLADVRPLTHVGLKTSWTLEQNLRSGGEYYVIVEACNRAGLCATSPSKPMVVDSSPPIPGVVLVGPAGVQSHYLPDRTTLTARWLNFLDPHSGIANYQWCVGTSSTQCDVIGYVEHFLMTSLLQGNLTLPVNTDLYLRVRAFNKAGLSCIGVSDRFRVDTTPPSFVSEPVFLDPYSEERRVIESQWEDSVLVVDWRVTDEDSPVVSQHLTVWAHGRVEIHESWIEYGVGRLGPYVIRPDDQRRLAPGDNVRFNVTACNAAGLCAQASSPPLLVDSSPPSVGGFYPKLSYTTTSSSSNVTLSWHGFEDVESGIRRIYVGMGRGYSDSVLSGGTIAIDKADIATLDIDRADVAALALDKADNTTVAIDTATIPLNTAITVGDFLLLTIWAENGVGLRSSVAKATVEAVADSPNLSSGFLTVQRHSCDPHYCTGDCTCAVVGGKCPPSRCDNLSQDIKATDDVNVTFTPTGGKGKVTASSSCLRARWSAVPQAERYEWSAALDTNSNDAVVPGFEVFHASEQVWHNSDRLTSFVYCLSPERSLQHGRSYVALVRVWYNSSTYHVFSSPPLTADVTAPALRPGASVSATLAHVTSSPDHRYENSSLEVAWPRVFQEDRSNVAGYDVMVGSHPGGDDVVPAVNVGYRESHTVNVTLHEGVPYHVTVVARNHVGLMTSKAARPILLDDEPPISGVVFTSAHYRDAYAQSNTSSLGVSWHGFLDRHSAFARHLVAVKDVASGAPSSSDFRYVTMATVITIDGLSLQHGHGYRAFVRAEDMSGHVSEMAASNAIRMDATPAKAMRCSEFKRVVSVFFRETGTRNSTPIQVNASMEQSNAIESGYEGVILLLTGGETYRLTFLGHAHLLHEGSGLILRLDPILDLVPCGHASSITLSAQADDELRVKLQEGDTSWPRVVNVTRCASTDVTLSDDASDAVHVSVTSPRHAHVSLHVTDPESGVQRVMIGLGTQEGGFQIQPLQPISGHVMLLPAGLPTTTPVYVTVYVENGAGLAVTFTSRITLDVTPPEVTLAKVKVTEASGGGSGKVKVAVDWSVEDEESDVTDCLYAIGSEKGSPSLVDWTSVPPKKGKFQSKPFPAQHGDILFLTLWCRNALDLDSHVTSGPFTVESRPFDSSGVLVAVMVADNAFSILPEPNVQPVGGLVRMRWEGFGADDVIGYQCRLLRDGTLLMNWTDVGLRNYMTFDIGQLPENAMTNITGEVRSFDGFEQHSLPVASSLLVDTRAPDLTGSSLVSNLTSPSSLLLDWSDVFSLPGHQMARYTLALGRRQGASDLLPPSSISGRTYAFPLPVMSRLSTVHVTVRATLPSGLSSLYAGVVSV